MVFWGNADNGSGTNPFSTVKLETEQASGITTRFAETKSLPIEQFSFRPEAAHPVTSSVWVPLSLFTLL